MPNDYFVRITHAWDKITNLVGVWALQSEKLVAYEHVGEKTEKVHCHILIMGSVVAKKQLRNIAADMLGINSVKGQENMAFRQCDSNWKVSLPYMTKGKFDPKYLHGFSEAEALVWKSQWVPPAEYTKVSSDQQLIDKFWTDEMFEKFNEYQRPETEPDIDRLLHYKFYWICKKAYIFCFENNGGIWNMKTRNQYYMLVMTTATRQRISIPRKHKFADIL